MKKQLKQILKKITLIQHIPYGVFVALFLISSVVSITALRHNNEHMIVLRNTVYSADQTNGDVNKALNNLRNYVYAHMNTNLSSGGNTIKPPIQLKYAYERLESAAQAAANNSGLYTTAENYCQQQIPASVSISGRGRITCVQDYISSHGGSQAKTIPAALYEFDFLSPTWSPDLAGWSLVATGLFAVLSILGFITRQAKRQ